MINKRLIPLGETKAVYGIVACQWGSMVLNSAMIFRLAYQLQEMYLGRVTAPQLGGTVAILLSVILLRSLLKVTSNKLSHRASSGMKLKLRTLLYQKLLALGAHYNRDLSTVVMLSDFTAHFPKGQITGIYGKSGSGKSTLLKLLMGFWWAPENSLTLSGVAVSKIQTDHLRTLETYMTQDTDIFHRTIILVSHRKSTLSICDRELTVAWGRVG